jgi:hypothetical protein
MTGISTLDPIVVHLRLVKNYSHAPDTRLRPPENNKPRSTRSLTARLKAACFVWFCPLSNVSSLDTRGMSCHPAANTVEAYSNPSASTEAAPAASS